MRLLLFSTNHCDTMNNEKDEPLEHAIKNS
jgi:hypothetical protein